MSKNSNILTLFLIESGILGIIGGIIGIVLGILLSKTVELIGTQFLGSNLLKASITLELVAGALIFSFIVGSVSGTLPARQASKLKPIDSLRYE